MRSKSKFISLLLIVSVVFFSCSKPHDPTTTTGISVGDTSNTALGTDSLGVGWQQIKIDTTRHLSDIFFLNVQTGFVCGQNYIGKSTDGGLTWTNTLPTALSADLVNLFFTDVNNGWAFGSRLLRTTDGGSTWTDLQASSTYDGQFFDANNGYITTNNGTLFKTSDGGVTLQRVLTSSQLRVLSFLDANHGWAASAGLFKTNDGGAYFQLLASVNPNEIYAAQFTDSLHGWLGGSVIYKTVDGGATLQKIIGSNSGGDIQFFDNNNGFIMCGNKIYSTSNGGETLNTLCRFKTNEVWEIHFVDPNHGWVVADGGFIYRYVKP